MSGRRIAILAALPRELKPMVRGWTRERAPRLVHLWTWTDAQGDVLVAACAGMGAAAVGRAFAAAEAGGKLDLVISVGLAGATGEEPRLGAVSAVAEVVDVGTGERFALGDGGRRSMLATVAQTAGAAEKARLRASYGAVLVDMEAATVARLVAMRGLPMGCFKAVSDGPDAVLPELDRFVDAEGQLRTGRFVAYLAVHPRYWRAVVRLAKNSSVAARALAASMGEFLQHKDWAYTNRTGRFERRQTARE